jgi:hypothetical protein
MADPDRRIAMRPRSLALAMALAASLVLGAPARAAQKGPTGPVFGGLRSASTCIPGPIGPGRTSSYHLTWRAARDKGTRPRKIRYEIYQAMTPGGEDFSHPTYTTAPGVTSFDTPALPTADVFFFVVRARDGAGNEDSNTVEREGQNLCL